MNAKRTTGICLVLCSFFLPQMSHAGGGWVNVKGSSYWKLSQSGVTSSGYFAGNLGFSPTLRSQVLTTALYFESGVGKRMSLEGYLPFYVTHSVEGSVMQNGNSISESDKVGSVGDMSVGLRYQLLKRDYLVVSTTFTLSIPSGITGGGERGNLFTGDGELNQILRFDLSVPYGSEKISAYSTIFLGANQRESPFENEWLYGFETGISHKKSRMWFIARIAGVSSTSLSPNTVDGSSYTNSQSFTSYEVQTAFYMDEQVGLSALYNSTFNEKVLLISPMYSIGLFYDLK